MAIEGGVSLNHVWDEFEAAAAALAKWSQEGGDEPEGEVFELTTAITLTLPDGREATGTLCIDHFDNEPDEPAALIGVALQMDTDEGALFEIVPYELGWDKERLVSVFNIDPDSPIWEVEESWGLRPKRSGQG